MYLLFETQEEAWERSEQEGMARGLAYHKVGSGTRYVSSPSITKKPLIGAASWALPVAGYNLTEEEQSSAVEEVTFPPVEGI
jgi:uncharacterized protein YoaH (UPF0181 family)